MPRLFDCYNIEEAEGIPVQYVGVYLLKWRERPEHPTVAFVESKYTTEMFDELLAACELALEAICAGAEGWMLSDVELKCRIAIAKAKGDDDGN